MWFYNSNLNLHRKQARKTPATSLKTLERPDPVADFKVGATVATTRGTWYPPIQTIHTYHDKPLYSCEKYVKKIFNIKKKLCFSSLCMNQVWNCDRSANHSCYASESRLTAPDRWWHSSRPRRPTRHPPPHPWCDTRQVDDRRAVNNKVDVTAPQMRRSCRWHRSSAVCMPSHALVIVPAAVTVCTRWPLTSPQTVDSSQRQGGARVYVQGEVAVGRGECTCRQD